MDKRLIWVDGDNFSGWCCSHCSWGMTVPHLDSTVAALAFNRTARKILKSTIAPSTETKHGRAPLSGVALSSRARLPR
jgi:hypothetical protein